MSTLMTTTYSKSRTLRTMDHKYSALQAHDGWKGQMDLITSEKLLENESPYVYILHQVDHQLYISYVNKKHTTYHVAFMIGSEGKHIYRNGWVITSDELEDFIPLAMHTTKDSCKPFHH